MTTQPHPIYTKEDERGARLNYLLCDVAARACHSVFHQILGYPQNPTDLFSHFVDRRTYGMLQNLRRSRGRVITDDQWELLFPPIPMLPDTRKFDLTLWIVLLRNICHLPPPSNGWDIDPNENDNTLSANLVRLRLCRNRLRGHVVSTSLSEAEFNKYWKEIEDILVPLGCKKVELDRRKTEPLDPDLVAKFSGILNNFQKMEDLMDKKINTIKEDIVRLTIQHQNIVQKVEGLQRNQGSLNMNFFFDDSSTSSGRNDVRKC